MFKKAAVSETVRILQMELDGTEDFSQCVMAAIVGV